jgi:uncharacterized protein
MSKQQALNKDRELRLDMAVGLPMGIRAGEGGKPATLFGYAAVFNVRSKPIWGSFIEIIKPGAFRASLERNDDVVCVVEHSGGLQLLGRRSSKTLEVYEDEKGLRYECQVPDTSAGKDISVLVGRGDIRSSSFAFRARKDEWTWATGKGELDVRTVIEADLFDVSPVVNPAYAEATVGVRSLDAYAEAKAARDQAIAREADTRLRLRLAEVNMSPAERHLAAAGSKS